MNWKDIFSLEERKISSLIICMFITLIYCLIVYWVRKDISINLVNILQGLIFGVVGVSATNTLQSFIDYKGQIKQLSENDNINNI